MKHILNLLLLITATFIIAGQTYAVNLKSKDWTLNGRIKQGGSILYDLENQGTINGPTNYLAEVKTSWRPNRKWTFIGNFWLRGDWAPGMDTIRSSGMHDPTDVAPGSLSNFNRRLPYRLNTSNCSGSAVNSTMDTFCASSKGIRHFDSADEIIRELSLKYRDRKNRFTVKIGKFPARMGTVRRLAFTRRSARAGLARAFLPSGILMNSEFRHSWLLLISTFVNWVFPSLLKPWG